MANLQDQYGKNPGETEIECLWRVSLTRGDRMLLNGKKANGYWEPDIFLNAVPNAPDDPYLLASRQTYWAYSVVPV